MKKMFIVFIGLLALGTVALCVLPGYVMLEADKVQITEQVLFGDPAIVEGVTVKSYYQYDDDLFWNTTYVAGEEPVTETEYRFRENDYSDREITMTWVDTRGYQCMEWMSGGLSGGWGISSSGSLDINEKSNITRLGLAQLYEELAKETKAGEEKKKTVYLNDYIDYYPIEIRLQDAGNVRYSFGTEEWDDYYNSYFKVPLQGWIPYEIELEKNAEGEIISLGGGVESISFNWNLKSICTDTDIYFAFCPYFDGKRIEGSESPGGFGIYRQPYSTERSDTVLYPEQLELFYPLTEEFYEGGELLLDINADGQLILITDDEKETRFQVVDLTTGELIENGAFLHESEDMSLAEIAWATDAFLVLCYRNYYYAVLDRQKESGYEHRMTVQVSSEDLLNTYGMLEMNAVDWDGERLLFVGYEGGMEFFYDICDFELAVYDETGQLYHGKYKSSLTSEQERQRNQEYESEWEAKNALELQLCEPSDGMAIEVSWP